MRLLLDTNVILDLLENREPFAKDAEALFVLAENNEAVECMSASAMTDIYYILSRGENGKQRARASMDKLLSLLTILPVTGDVLRYAHNLNWEDFEDAVQYAAARFNAVNYIITRNKKDYESSDIEIMAPGEFLEFFETEYHLR